MQMGRISIKHILPYSMPGFSVEGDDSINIVFAGILASTTAAAQKITLNERNAPLKKYLTSSKGKANTSFFMKKIYRIEQLL